LLVLIIGALLVVVLVVLVALRSDGVRQILTPAPKVIPIAGAEVSSDGDKAAAEQKLHEASQITVNIRAKLQVLADDADVLSRG